MMKRLSTKLLLFMMAIFLSISVIAAQADDDDDGDYGENEDDERVGLIESRPSGFAGTWVIGGISYTVTNETHVEEEHGPLSVGQCAEITLVKASSSVVTEIESEEGLKCGTTGGGYSYLQTYGTLSAFPAGLIGAWQVNGVSYTADNTTEFEQEDGPFQVGGCVEIKYVPTSNKILEVESEESYKCASGNSSDYAEVRGILTSFPTNLVGNWVVDGVTYIASASTQFEQEYGAFFNGRCVEIKFLSNNNNAVEIETAKSNDCVTSSVSNSQAETKFYGLLESIPAGNIGTWQVSGFSFQSDGATQLNQEDGLFAVGACVEIEYIEVSGIKQAVEIETESAYHCHGSSYTNKAYGTIDSYPSSFYGTWVIDGIAYVSKPQQTEIDQKEYSFSVGGCAQVEYYTENGVHYATEIEAENTSDCTGSGSPSEIESTGKIYALVESFSASPHMGTWIIGGDTYQSTASTEFEQEHGGFAVGQCVEGEYILVGGVKTLTEIETEHSYKCEAGTSNTDYSSYGVAEIIPATTDLTGNWQIGGITYVANNSTIFSQEHGFFAVGAYLEVYYTVSNGIKTATKIETHVASGSGSDTSFGTVDQYDPNDDWADWVIDGITYKADPTIKVTNNTPNSGNRTLAKMNDITSLLGEQVIINSYVTNNVRYVTSVTVAEEIYLPLSIQP